MRYIFGVSFISLFFICPVLAMTLDNHAQSPFATLEVLDPTPDVASLDNKFLNIGGEPMEVLTSDCSGYVLLETGKVEEYVNLAAEEDEVCDGSSVDQQE